MSKYSIISLEATESFTPAHLNFYVNVEVTDGHNCIYTSALQVNVHAKNRVEHLFLYMCPA